ncbi:MAG: hypothetical protein ACREBG_09490 [Pyrinomonadaceae bacterium]
MTARRAPRLNNELRSLHFAVSDTALRFEPTTALRNRVRSAVRDESEVTNRSLRLSWRWIIPAVSFAVLLSSRGVGLRSSVARQQAI